MLPSQMASIGHVAVGMAAGRAYTKDPALQKKAMIVLSIVSLWPDADAIAFAMGIPYGDPLGHRGATHSLALAAVVGGLAWLVAFREDLPRARTALYAGIVAASHGLLDTMTYGGGLGCALLWPFSNERFWAPVRFIPIAPIGLALFSLRGVKVMLAEIVIFSPFWIYALWPRRK
jgi:inner membrane protein